MIRLPVAAAVIVLESFQDSFIMACQRARKKGDDDLAHDLRRISGKICDIIIDIKGLEKTVRVDVIKEVFGEDTE